MTGESQWEMSVPSSVELDVRLQELASLIRATETRQGRLGALAAALTEELILSDEWLPQSLSARQQYQVSHLDSPVLGPAVRPVLMLSLVPVPSSERGPKPPGSVGSWPGTPRS